MTTDYDMVVLDGANIIHDDTGIVKHDTEGNKILQILPERLEMAIKHCENLGWPTVACLKRGTYKWAATNPNSPNVGDISIIDRLISEGKVELISAKKEDIFWIDYALKENAWIVTHDRFNDKKEGPKGERSTYPDRDWDDIDRRTLREYEFVNNKFILPGLPKKEVLEKVQSENITRAQFNKLARQVEELQKMIREITHSEVKKEVERSTHGNKNETSRDIMEAVINQSLSNEKRVEIGHFHRLIGSAILGLDITDYPKGWPKGWTKKLSAKLGFDGKFYDALIKNSKKKICIGPKEGKKGTTEIFYC